VGFQKISILPPQKGLEFPGGVGGSMRPKNLKKCMKGGEVWGGMGRFGYFLDIFWNYTMWGCSGHKWLEVVRLLVMSFQQYEF